jgi:hypothetical protein
MGNSHKRAATLKLAVLVSFILLLLPGALLARGPSIRFVDVETETIVGGEPGEDPHLKLPPVTRPIQESQSTAGAGEVCAGGVEGASEGLWEGESGLGSRVNRVWRLVLQMWFWTVQR